MLLDAKGEYPNVVYAREKGLWSSVDEARADFEVMRRYGQEASVSTPGDRLGCLFEDVWKIETRIASTLIRILENRYGSEWWQERIFPQLSLEQKRRLTSIKDDIEALNEIRKTLFHPARFGSFDENDYEHARKVRTMLWDE